MARQNILTPSGLDARIREVLKDAGPDLDERISDGDGLFLRVRPSSKAWYFQYPSPTRPGHRPKMPLGMTYPTTSLSAAREKVKEYRTQVEAGIDPQDHLEQKKQQKALVDLFGKAPDTIAELAARWRKDWCQVNHADQGEYAYGMLERHALPLIGKLKLSDVRAQHIVSVLTAIQARGLGNTAGRVLSILRQMFNHAVEADWLQGNPTSAISKKKWGDNTIVERHLAEQEIVELATKLPVAKITPEIECAVWLMLSCLTRVEETSLVQLKHIDKSASTWFVPAENQKQVAYGNFDHTINLSPFALNWFERLQELTATRLEKRARRKKQPVSEVDFLLPARTRPGPMDKGAIRQAMESRQWFDGVNSYVGEPPTPLHAALNLSGGYFSPHDLRRSGATLMSELGIQDKVIEKCLNHRNKTPYIHSKLRAQMAEAWTVLGEKLEEIYAEGQRQLTAQQIAAYGVPQEGEDI